MKLKPFFFIISIGAFAVAGCASYPDSQAMIQDAIALKPRVDDLRTTTQQQLAAEDQSYRDTYNRLTQQIQTLSRQEMIDIFNLDGQRAADAILADWQENTLPGKFRDRFYDMMTNHLQMVLTENDALEAARTNYANNYKQIKLSLDGLTKIDSGLVVLSQPDNGLPPEEVSAFIGMAVSVGETITTNKWSK